MTSGSTRAGHPSSPGSSPWADLFDGYSLGEQWDEMFGGIGEPRAAYAWLFSSLQPMAGDVPPFKGLCSEPRSEGHTVTVEVTRLA